jgi:predicted O-methyltransferase YrrM
MTYSIHHPLALPQDLKNYIELIGTREPQAMQALRAYNATLRLAKMQLAPEQAQLMHWLVKLTQARRYLELGVFTGYSTLAMALALPDAGEIVACDISEEFTVHAEKAWQAAGVRHKIDLRIAPAKNSLADLLAEGKKQYFDIVLIDADKPNYPHYYEMALQLTKQNGIIILDNMLLNGRVIQKLQGETPGVNAVRALNTLLHTDERVELVMLPLGDGMTLLRKR